MRPLRRDGAAALGRDRHRDARAGAARRAGAPSRSTTGTALARLRRPETFQQVLEDMLGLAPSSCRVLGARLGVNRMTVWRWRKRILAALTGVGADGLAASWRPTRSSCGSRARARGNGSITNGTRCCFPKPDRPRWQDYQRLGLLRPAGVSKWQIPVLTLADRAGARRADLLPDRRAQSLVAVLDRHVGQRRGALLGRGRRLRTLRQGTGAAPLPPQAQGGPKVIRTAFHLQTVNNLHSRFESFMKPFCGPATKNLPGYAAWLIARLTGDQTAATRRGLAAAARRVTNTNTDTAIILGALTVRSSPSRGERARAPHVRQRCLRWRRAVLPITSRCSLGSR